MAIIIGEFGSAPEHKARGYESLGITVRGTEESVLRTFGIGNTDTVLVAGCFINGTYEREFLPMVRKDHPVVAVADNELCFLDMETGGLNGPQDNGEIGARYYPILEIALHVSDKDLNVIGEGLRIVIHHDEEAIQKLHPWALEQHAKSGLLEEVRKSQVTLQQAETMCIEYLQSVGARAYNRESKTGTIMAGNSIRFDRDFLDHQMPTLSKFFHYRQFDLSAINLACRLWAPEVNGKVHKKYKHLALEDILDSIDEARVYKNCLF